MELMTGREEFVERLALLNEMASMNPCGMSDVAFRALATGLNALIGKEREKGMSLEQVAVYFGVSTKTIERWEKDESLSFPKGKRYGHRELSFSTDKIVLWAKKHPEKMKENK